MSNLLIQNAMENLNERVAAIVTEEVSEMKAVLDAWFDKHESETKLEIPAEKRPDINLKSEDGKCVYYIDYNVSEIRKYRQGYTLLLYQYENGCGNDEETWEVELDNTNFIPGEISRLKEVVENLVKTPGNTALESIYNFSHEQIRAIADFNLSLKLLHENKVMLLVDNERENFRFANGEKVVMFCRTNDVDPSYEVNFEELPKSDELHDGDFFASEGLCVTLDKDKI